MGFDLGTLALALIGLVIFGAPIVMALGVVNFFDQLLAKPKPPVVKETAEEIAVRQANVLAMVRRHEAMRDNEALKPKSKSFFGDGSRPSPADWSPTSRIKT